MCGPRRAEQGHCILTRERVCPGNRTPNSTVVIDKYWSFFMELAKKKNLRCLKTPIGLGIPFAKGKRSIRKIISCCQSGEPQIEIQEISLL